MKVDPAKIDALIRELRSWEPGEVKHTARELAAQFQLEPYVIQQIAKSEGLTLKVGETGSDEVDQHIPTQPIEPIAWPDRKDD